MGTRSRLQDNMEYLSRKKQAEFEHHNKWMDNSHYYKRWDKMNVKYGEWTSEDYYQTKMSEMEEDLKKKQKQEQLDTRREKLRKLFIEDDKSYGMELLESPRERRYPRKKHNEYPATDVLTDINLGLKLAEEEKRRHEAEMQLYNQWRNNNPILREHETNQNRASLKMAWLDQQIEKRMHQEKQEQEFRRMLEDRQRLLKEQEEIEKLEKEYEQKKEKILQEQIEENMKAFKKNEEKKEEILIDQSIAKRDQRYLEEILERRQKDLERRQNKKTELYNLSQSKLKLRKRAIEIQDELRNERFLLEDIERLKLAEALVNEEERTKAKNAIKAYQQYVQEQQRLEQQRQQYISFVFDSEAKLMWQKQEKVWISEQQNRDKLLNNVLNGLKKQIDEKLERSQLEAQMIEKEKEEALRNIEVMNRQIQREKELLERKKQERRMELDKQINDKRLSELEQKLEEEKKKKLEIENIKKEEEKLRNELMQLQRGKYHPARYQRATHLW